MSKKKIVNKRLLKGKFYVVHDGSASGHPGMIYWKQDKKNLYLVIVTGTSYTKDLIKLIHPTDKNVKQSFIKKKPFLGKRKDFGSKEMKGMKFHKIDKKRVIREVSKKEPTYSNSIKRNDKRYFKRIRKKKIPKY